MLVPPLQSRSSLSSLPGTLRRTLAGALRGVTSGPAGRAGLLAVLALSVAACTTDNPEYQGPVCEPGQRRCGTAVMGSGQAVAQVCGRAADDSVAYIDEACPLSAACDAGRCTAPAGARACRAQRDCDDAGQICAALVSSATQPPAVAMFCVPKPAAAVAPGAACTTDSDCQSYRCLQHARGRYCLQACEAGNQCATRASCLSLNVTISGVQGTVLTCSPP